MVHRVPRLPKANMSEIFFMGAAGVGVLAPIYLVLPGADKQLANQTEKWAPRWEKNISYFAPPVERGVQRLEPPVSRIVQRVDERLPLEKMAKGLEKGIRGSIERFGPKSS
ncbi:hypothetical protein B0I35DRAFT_161503 [Stachybotrys elegans]|uniref:4-coumarate:coenzyme A ligase n=1 Tax=Stachybotrys elegans TaxID=80388 RepID=A0A8K0SYT8_9HYPO|nr:hypothetical protein B0I35DRAFT_161503 [Stachybotrys elegans]